jgi:endoglucanase
VGCDSAASGGDGACESPFGADREDEFEAASPQQIVEALGRGVNFGNMFDAPAVGAWNISYDPAYPALVAEAGFDHVRLPVRWSNHAAVDEGAELDPQFACEIDHVIHAALSAGLGVVLDAHHYRQLDGDGLDPGERPVDESVVEERLVNIWRQLGERYRKLPNRLVFEPYNEPHNRLNVERWNQLLVRLLAAVRESNPERAVMFGGSEWDSAFALEGVEFPDDPNLIATFHHYEPISFTFQGSTFPNSQMWVGTKCCDEEQQATIRRGLDAAQAFRESSGIPVYLGEWGSSLSADLDSRAAYARFMREEAEARGISWAVWSLVDYGIYRPSEQAFIPEMKAALLGE